MYNYNDSIIVNSLRLRSISREYISIRLLFKYLRVLAKKSLCFCVCVCIIYLFISMEYAEIGKTP